MQSEPKWFQSIWTVTDFVEILNYAPNAELLPRVGSSDGQESKLILIEHLLKWKCPNKTSYISHLSVTQYKHIRGFFFLFSFFVI